MEISKYVTRSDEREVPPSTPPIKDLLKRSDEKTSQTVLTFNIFAELQRIAQERLGADEHVIPIPRISLRDLTDNEIASIAQRADVLWLNGLFRRNKEQEMDVKNHWQDYRNMFPNLSANEIKERIGASSFAADVQANSDGTFAFVPDERVGSWEDIGAFINKLRLHGTQVWMDLIAHVAYGTEEERSDFVQRFPELLVHTTTDPKVAGNAYMFHPKPIEKDGKNYWIAYGSWNNGEYGETPEEKGLERWKDIAVLNLANDTVRKSLRAYARRMGSFADGARVDTAALFDEEVFLNNWGKYLSEDDVEKLKGIIDGTSSEKRLLEQLSNASKDGANTRPKGHFVMSAELYPEYRGAVDRVSSVVESPYFDPLPWIITESMEGRNEYSPEELVELINIWLQDRFFRNKTIYSATHDNEIPLLRRVKKEVLPHISGVDPEKFGLATIGVVEWLTTLLPAKYHLLPPMPLSYEGEKWQVFASAFPQGNWWRDSLESQTLSVIQNSEIWQSQGDMSVTMSNNIISLQKIDPKSGKGIIVCLNLKPWKDNISYLHLPQGAENVKVFLQNGSIVTNASNGKNGIVHMQLHGVPDEFAQIVYFDS